MIVLGIETTCDETAVAVVVDGKHILSNVIASQAELHSRYGGVFPEMAAREHVNALIPTINEALTQAGIDKKEIDLIAVAKGPGLIGPLLVGVNGAKALALALDIPFVGVNHIEAHLYAALLSDEAPSFPALGVVVSGGHTFLAMMHDLGHYELIGSTVDDAVGEAFDKVAALLDLPYPGGPEIEKLAKMGDHTRYPFKAGVVKERPFDFSFSGLKTNVMYTLKGQNGNKTDSLVIPEEEKPHVAASFQHAALSAIVDRASMAAKQISAKKIYVGGGVSCNQYFRNLFEKEALPIYWPGPSLSLDNGAMIAGLGYHVYQNQGASSLDMAPKTRIPLSTSVFE